MTALVIGTPETRHYYHAVSQFEQAYAVNRTALAVRKLYAPIPKLTNLEQCATAARRASELSLNEAHRSYWASVLYRFTNAQERAQR